MLRAEAGQVLGRDEREVHAGLEHVAFVLRAVHVEALRMTHEVRDRTLMLSDQDMRRVTGEPLPQLRQMLPEPGPQQQRRRTDRAAGYNDQVRRDAIFSR